MTNDQNGWRLSEKLVSRLLEFNRIKLTSRKNTLLTISSFSITFRSLFQKIKIKRNFKIKMEPIPVFQGDIVEFTHGKFTLKLYP